MCLSGGGRRVRLLHSSFNLNLLPQNASEPATARDPESDGDAVAVAGQLQRGTVDVDRRCGRRGAPPVVDVPPVAAHVDAGQAEDGAPRGVLLHRVRLQRLVHVRAHHQVRRQPQQAGVHARAGEPHRPHRHRLLLPRLHSHLSQEGERRARVLQHHPHHATVQGSYRWLVMILGLMAAGCTGIEFTDHSHSHSNRRCICQLQS